jgi:hypothetical protein
MSVTNLGRAASDEIAAAAAVLEQNLQQDPLFVRGAIINAWDTAGQEGKMRSDLLAPEYSTTKTKGQLVEDDGAEQTLVDTNRAPSATANSVRFGIEEGAAYHLTDQELRTDISDEALRESNEELGIDLVARYSRKLAALGRYALERRVVQLYVSRAVTEAGWGAANESLGYYGDGDLMFTVAANDKWDTTTAKPLTLLNAMTQAVRNSGPVEPNAIFMNLRCADLMIANGDIVELLGIGMDRTGLDGKFLNGKTIQGKTVYVHEGHYKSGSGAAWMWPEDLWVGYIGPWSDLGYAGHALNVTHSAAMPGSTVEYIRDIHSTRITANFGIYQPIIAKRGGSVSGCLASAIYTP